MDIQGSIILKLNGITTTLYLKSLLDNNEILFELNPKNGTGDIERSIFVDSDEAKVYIENSDASSIEDKILIDKEFPLNYDDFLPGHNFIEIEYHNQTYLKFFYVTPPSSLGEEGVIKIRSIIEELSPGLSLDYSDRAIENIVIANYINNSDKIKTKYLSYNYSKIITSLTKISENPIDNLIKEIKNTGVLRKENNKTIKQAIQKKTEVKVYGLKTINTVNCPENAMLCYILLSIKKNISIMYNNLKVEVIETNELEKKAKKMFTHNEKYLDSLLIGYQRKINSIEPLLSKLYRLIINIDKTFYSLDLKNININTRTLSPKFLKNKSYNFILQVYRLISARKIDFIMDKESQNRSISFKKTPVLFELYTYVFIKNILLNNGYKFVVNNEDQPVFKQEFLREDSKYIIYYNQDCFPIDLFIEKEMDEGFVYIMKKGHSTPDFIIAKFDTENKIQKLFIIEAKCRIIKNVFSEGVTEQLRDYTLLKYIDKDNPMVNPISHVICIYPYNKTQKQEAIRQNKYEYISYVGLEVLNKLEKEEAYHYLNDMLME